MHIRMRRWIRIAAALAAILCAGSALLAEIGLRVRNRRSAERDYNGRDVSNHRPHWVLSIPSG